jgi:hypothetical protein
MTTALAGTSSGSFLVSDAVINSQNSILPPMGKGPPSIPKPNLAHLDPMKPDPNYQTNSQLIARMERTWLLQNNTLLLLTGLSKAHMHS